MYLQIENEQQNSNLFFLSDDNTKNRDTLKSGAMLTLPRDRKMGSQSPLCLEGVPRKGKAVRQQNNNIVNKSSGHGICEFMGLC